MIKQIIISSFLWLFPSSLLAESPRVLTTTGMIADLVQQLAGSYVSVDSLMGPGIDPHLYKPTQGDLERLLKADLVFYNGLHLEGKMSDILAKLAKKKKVIAVSEKINTSLLLKPAEFEGNYDPHIWFDVQLWSQAAEVVAQHLFQLIPEYQATIKSNHSKYQQELLELDAWVRQQIQLIPSRHRVLITAHDAFGYFGKAYGIEVIGLQGISTAAEFGLHDIVKIVDLVVTREIPAIFVESSVPKKFITAVQEAVKAKNKNVIIGGELFSDALGAPNSTAANYIGMLQHNVKTIVRALT